MTDVGSVDADTPEPGKPGRDVDGRRALLRRSILLQLKLVVDGLRDFLLVPIAMGATLMGLLRGGDEPAREFNRVIELGRATDEWIDLFGIHQAPGSQSSDIPGPGVRNPAVQSTEVQTKEDGDGEVRATGEQPPDPGHSYPRNLEEWANRAEAVIQNEIKSGELSEQAARALRRALGRLQEDHKPARQDSKRSDQ